MITQEEIQAYAKLKDAASKYDDAKKALIERMEMGEAIEPGPLTLTHVVNPGSSIAYKKVVDRISELHPELRSGISRLIESNTNPSPKHSLNPNTTIFGTEK